eukprot:5457198-Amphidinium_carterae.1
MSNNVHIQILLGGSYVEVAVDLFADFCMTLQRQRPMVSRCTTLVEHLSSVAKCCWWGTWDYLGIWWFVTGGLDNCKVGVDLHVDILDDDQDECSMVAPKKTARTEFATVVCI